MLNDARIYQIGFLACFLLLGVSTRDWTIHPSSVMIAIATCLITQSVVSLLPLIVHSQPETQSSQIPNPNSSSVAAHSTIQNLKSLLSAPITALGLSLLLRVDHPGTMVLAAGLAILSKFLLRLRGKHLFNPGNFGIIAALTLTQDAWVSPGQWGEGQWYALLFLAAGGIVLQRVGRWDTSVVFLASYAGLEAARTLWLGWTWDVWAHRLMSGSLLIFALFMITDPRTIPDSRMGRSLWALSLALLTFWLRNFCFLATAPFWALFILSPTGVLWDLCFPGDRFEWHKTNSASALPTQETQNLQNGSEADAATLLT